MLKPTREQLTHLFTCSDIFKGIDVAAAINTFYAKIYPKIKGQSDWCIENNDQDSPQMAAMLAHIRSLLAVERILISPDLWELDTIALKDEPDINPQVKGYDLKIWQDGSVEYIQQTQAYQAGKYSSDPYSLEGTFFGMDQADAIRKSF